MAATRAQKMRLGIFLLVTTGIVIATLVYLLGASLMEVRDAYVVVLKGGSDGLEVGSQVRFNDIVVGRIERVGLDKDDPSQVIINLTVDHGTPINEDTIAVPEMANITGTKMLSMHGGTKNSRLLNPGDTIQSATSDLSMITTKVVNIADKLEDLLDNLVAVTNSSNLEKVSNVLTEIEGITANLNQMLDENKASVRGIVTDARSIMGKVDASLGKVDNALGTVEKTINDVATPHNIRMITTILNATNALIKTVAQRAGDEELGQTIQSVNRLTNDTNVTVLRLRTDLQHIMRELEASVENINEFTQILVENPSVLISGRNEKERRLP